ncbi:Transcriptional regulator [Pseudomonas sp. IT-P260]
MPPLKNGGGKWSFTESSIGFAALQALLKDTMALRLNAGEVTTGCYLRSFEMTRHSALK